MPKLLPNFFLPVFSHKTKVNGGKWRAHDATVQKLQFNCFNSDIILTLGGDWSVKIWKLNIVKLCPLPCILIHMTTHVLDAGEQKLFNFSSQLSDDFLKHFLAK